ncbi:acyl-CoA carboxylase subunit beta [Coprothermobacteraceae bacterium]|nr:acyl-CoA carboxylase subunit beta [Coprothermobacteraceae bacterium]
MGWEELLEEYRKRKEVVIQGGGKEKLQKIKESGKLTARERIEYFLDPNSFVEVGTFVEHRATVLGMDKVKAAADGVVTGFGTVNGRLVFVASQDFSVLGGSVGEMHAAKIARVQEMAMAYRAPIIIMNDSGGARIQEGVDSLKGYGDIFYRNVQASGHVPQIAIIFGPCAGGAVYSPALMDFVVMTNSAYMFITGPRVVEAVTGEKVTTEQLGGPNVHAEKSGNIHFVAETDQQALDLARQLLSFLPSSADERPPYIEPQDDPARLTPEVAEIVPAEANKAFDIRDFIRAVVDDGEFLEVQADFGRSIVVGFARLGGHTIGIIANQPAVMAGVLDIDSSDKAARFVRTCNAFNIPVVTFVDTPGYMPGTRQEYGGIIRHGAKLLYAYSEAEVAKITLIVRKAFGGAYIAMGSKHLGADVVFALPSAQIAVMEAEGGANIVFKKEIESAENPEKVRAKKIAEYRSEFLNPYVAASRLYIDDVIEPQFVRLALYNALEVTLTKKNAVGRKHGNIPL